MHVSDIEPGSSSLPRRSGPYTGPYLGTGPHSGRSSDYKLETRSSLSTISGASLIVPVPSRFRAVIKAKKQLSKLRQWRFKFSASMSRSSSVATGLGTSSTDHPSPSRAAPTRAREPSSPFASDAAASPDPVACFTVLTDIVEESPGQRLTPRSMAVDSRYVNHNDHDPGPSRFTQLSPETSLEFHDVESQASSSKLPAAIP